MTQIVAEEKAKTAGDS